MLLLCSIYLLQFPQEALVSELFSYFRNVTKFVQKVLSPTQKAEQWKCLLWQFFKGNGETQIKWGDTQGGIIKMQIIIEPNWKKAKREISTKTVRKRELKKLWNLKVTVIPTVFGALDTVTKELVNGQEDLVIRGRVETIQSTALLRSVRILRRVLET